MDQALIFCFQNAKATGALGVIADNYRQGGHWGGAECRQECVGRALVGNAVYSCGS